MLGINILIKTNLPLKPPKFEIRLPELKRGILKCFATTIFFFFKKKKTLWIKLLTRCTKVNPNGAHKTEQVTSRLQLAVDLYYMEESFSGLKDSKRPFGVILIYSFIHLSS